MGRYAPGLVGRPASREGDQQCLIRDANEAMKQLNAERDMGDGSLEMRCECGDPACLDSVRPSHAEYEAVRSYGSRFMVHLNHENPETASVVSENERFAVIDVVAGDARHQALARNTRHQWVDAVSPDDNVSPPSSASERSPI